MHHARLHQLESSHGSTWLGFTTWIIHDGYEPAPATLRVRLLLKLHSRSMRTMGIHAFCSHREFGIWEYKIIEPYLLYLIVTYWIKDDCVMLPLNVQAGTKLSHSGWAARVFCLEEVAMVVLASAMDFGSSWRDELRSFHGKGAWPTVFWRRPSFSCFRRVGSNNHVMIYNYSLII